MQTTSSSWSIERRLKVADPIIAIAPSMVSTLACTIVAW
jgi:hypothetical protein